MMRIARTEPLANQLLLKEHSTDKMDPFWPGDADPDKVRGYWFAEHVSS
jgi:hypothetical protein